MELFLELINSFLHILDGLLIFLVNTPFAFNLVLQFVDSLLQQDFVVQ